MTISVLALSRTCDLSDFPDCITVAAWQQRLAEHAWALWTAEQHLRTREASLVVNYSGVEFLAPGPSAIYSYRQRDEPVIEHAVPAVYGLCVLDHIEAPARFLQRAAQILRPAGLLFLTFTFWNAEGPDVAEGHEVRTRIYDAKAYTKLIAEARRTGLVTYGGIDWKYHGNKLEDHSLASLVLTRR